MNRMPGCRLNWAVVFPVPPMGDVGAFEATVVPHPYLYCVCSERLWQGDTATGAPILYCRRCQIVVDTRRLA